MTNSTGPRTEEAASADTSTLYAVDGKAPGYKDTETMETAFRGVYKDYIKSSGAIELKKALEHMKGQIDHIIIVGLGSPDSGDKQVFKQLAMIQVMRDTLEDHNPKREVKVSQCDPRTQSIDEAFLWDHRQIEEIRYDHNVEKTDKRPDFCYLDCQYKTREERSDDAKSDIKGVVDATTNRTLLFFPYTPFSVVLRILSKKVPGMFIAHSIDALYNNIIVKKNFATPDTVKHFGVSWKAEFSTLEKLKTANKTARTELEHTHETPLRRLWVYRPIMNKSEISKYDQMGWIRGDRGLVLDDKAAENAYVDDDEQGRAQQAQEAADRAKFHANRAQEAADEVRREVDLSRAARLAWEARLDRLDK